VHEFTSDFIDERLALVRELGQILDIPLIITGPEMWNAIRKAAVDGLQAALHDMLQNLAAQSEKGEFMVAEGITHNCLSERMIQCTMQLRLLQAAENC
jgi:hypothetical protein